MTETTIYAIEHIARTPGVRGGVPCVAGTRISVGDVVVASDAGWEAAVIAQEFGLTLAQVYAALAYFHDHPDDIRRQLSDDADTANALLEKAGAYGSGGHARIASVGQGGGADLTTEQVAAELGVTPSRVRQLILDGTLPAVKRGGVWFVSAGDVDRARERPGPGYPKGRPRSAGPGD
jgi:excisionase family DNA binding protein